MSPSHFRFPPSGFVPVAQYTQQAFEKVSSSWVFAYVANNFLFMNQPSPRVSKGMPVKQIAQMKVRSPSSKLLRQKCIQHWNDVITRQVRAQITHVFGTIRPNVPRHFSRQILTFCTSVWDPVDQYTKGVWFYIFSPGIWDSLDLCLWKSEVSINNLISKIPSRFF